MSSNDADRVNHNNGLSFSSPPTSAYFQGAYSCPHRQLYPPFDCTWGRSQQHEGYPWPFSIGSLATQASVAAYHPPVEYCDPSPFISPPCSQPVPHVLPLVRQCNTVTPVVGCPTGRCCIHHFPEYGAPILASLFSESLNAHHAPVCIPLAQGAWHADMRLTDSTISNVGRDQHNYFIQVTPKSSAGDPSNAMDSVEDTIFASCPPILYGRGVDDQATMSAASTIPTLPESITNSPTSTTTRTTFRYSFFSQEDRLCPQIRTSCLRMGRSDGAPM